MQAASLALDTLKHERDRFVAFAFASADLLIELDDTGAIAFVDGATMGLLGQRADDLIGQHFSTLVHERDKNAVAQLLSQSEQIGRTEGFKLRLNSRIHKSLPFAVSGFQLPYLKHHYFLTLSIVREEIAPDELAKRDIHSGLLKRENFAEAANKKIHEAVEAGKQLKMTLLDFPELKALLDGLPAQQANDLIGEISDYLRSKSVDGDTAGIIGKSAYSFVHDGAVDQKSVVKYIVDLAKKADPSGVGVTTPRAHTIDTDPGKLSEQDTANALLYTLNRFATEKGENFSIDSLTAGYQTMLDDTVVKIANFKNTVAHNEFMVAFQPIVNLKDGVIHHFETLVRLDSDKGFSNPFHFITFGEQSGVINEFDLAMCQKTLDILQSASKKGYRPLVSVNLSGKSLSSNLFMDTVSEMLRQNESVRKQVIFEVTESAKISNLQQANVFLQTLRDNGNLVCLDDFGVGESSFDYLRHLQVDFVKIDGSYVKESLTTQRGKHLLKAMAGLCRDLNIVTIGEMVEDEKVAAILWESGVKFGQGYLFGKPTVDEQTLLHCAKPTPYYAGIMRAKKIKKAKSAWWKRSDD